MEEKTRILIIEHDQNDIDLLLFELEKGGINFVFQVVRNAKDLRIALPKFIPDIILSDFSLPSFGGLVAFKIKEELSPDTPFIFVSGTIGEEKAVELIKIGVTDYALKEKLFTLLPKIARALKESEEKKSKKIIAELIIKNEKQRRFDKNNLNALINNTKDLMWSVDRDFNLITSNIPFDEMSKMNFGRIIEKGECVLSVSFTPEMLNHFKRLYERAFEGEFFVETDYFAVPVENWAEISYAPIRKDEQVMGAACQSHDVTERKLAEREREKMITNIVQHSKNLEQFATIVSHNLRAPVVNIMGITSILRSNISKEEREKSQQYLLNATENLDEILKDLNKILEVRSEINEYKETVYFDDLVDTIKSSIHTIIEKEKVVLETDFSSIDKISSIKSYMYSIFYNLVFNSIKYRKHGITSLIRIQTELNKETIKISFQDNGVGIDLAKNGDKIFGLYKRFDPNTEGKGLGLFMVKTQVETLGGNIRVESKYGEGAKFIIEIPQ